MDRVTVKMPGNSLYTLPYKLFVYHYKRSVLTGKYKW